jgi:hypothetical protein
VVNLFNIFEKKFGIVFEHLILNNSIGIIILDVSKQTDTVKNKLMQLAYIKLIPILGNVIYKYDDKLHNIGSCIKYSVNDIEPKN